MSAKEFSMMDIAPTASAILGLPAPAQAKGVPIREVVSGLTGAGRVAVLAPDGLGTYAWRLWKAEMPYLSSLHGRNSIRVRSVMPSITPVNFATMVTGTDLAGHGVHTFKDDFACETLFDIVRKAKAKSAGVGLDGYTGSELLGRCADIWGNAGNGSDDAVADKIIEIAEDAAPEFLIAQLGRVDDIFHQHGPSSPLVVPMLKETDARLMRLVEHLKPLRYGIVILADHGQHDLTEPSTEGLKGTHGTDSPEDCLVACTWI
jgi:predicted AlkP superfamily pyrophosphatase or phosphodiesterase